MSKEALTMSDSVTVKEEMGIKEEPSSMLLEGASPSKTKNSISKPIKKERSPPSVASSSKAPTIGPQLIGHLPLAEKEALASFVELEECTYQFSTIGRTKELEEGYVCDCVYEPGVSDLSEACGDGSECINRLTQVECDVNECRCRSYCQNRRFQLKQTANIEIVLTERKGFGIRAAEDIPRDTFIYEYIGEVVGYPSFKKRMREYGDEGLQHFYFMMLQKDEFIDATKKGGIGRFVNHSCNPNAYVAKWTVGKRLRMGIFARRDILKNEELTFNYNVDRYGHDAQTCYCGEPQCTGFIGGKTQTDLTVMDDLTLEALGISEEVASSRKKGKQKKLEDVTTAMKSLLKKDIPNIMRVMKETTSKKVMTKLLTRIKLTDDPVVLRQIMRLRGFSLMRALFQEYKEDIEVICLAMESMLPWPLEFRNKVDDSRIEENVSEFLESSNEQARTLAQKLVEHWGSFTVSYRIPKRAPGQGPEIELTGNNSLQASPVETTPTVAALKKWQTPPDVEFTGPKPLGTSYSETHLKQNTTPSENTQQQIMDPIAILQQLTNVQRPEQSIKDIIDSAIKASQAAAQAAEEERKAAEEKEKEKKRRREERAEKEREHKRRKEERAKDKQRDKQKEKETNGESSTKQVELKEKKLMKFVSNIVVGTMSKHRSEIDGSVFKKHAKEITRLIAEKEKASSTYAIFGTDQPYPDSRKDKMKKFTKAYTHKLLKKIKAHKESKAAHHGGRHTHSHVAVPPPSDKTPDGDDMRIEEIEMGDMNIDVEDLNDDDDVDEPMVVGLDADEEAPGPGETSIFISPP